MPGENLFIYAFGRHKCLALSFQGLKSEATLHKAMWGLVLR